MESSLRSAFPGLGDRVVAVELGEFPTPVERLSLLERELGSDALYVKRDDSSSPVYGGNKVRTLEVLFGLALARGQREIVAVGAYGSNHAVATVLHAPRAGLASGAMLFPQPTSWAALENLRVSVARAGAFRALPHWAFVPPALWLAAKRERMVMPPGGANPDGALGYVAAALELAFQVAGGDLPAPSALYVGVGSTCTSAGLLVGFAHAARLGIGFERAPTLHAVRVTPWPVTARFRILGLAVRSARRLAELAGDARLALSARELAPRLELGAADLGPGYGEASASGLEAIELHRRLGLFPLDTTYSGKAAAGFLRAARARRTGPLLFWSTKSTVPLPAIMPAELQGAPRRVLAWMRRAEAELANRADLPPGYERLV